MKSRKFLPNIPTETSGPIAKGFLLARSPQGDVAAGAAVRRYELQHNQSPRFARRRQERRKGQALLLAVLIMLLAALLSAGFLAVVSGNLNQSARIADKTRAIEASRAGIAYANAQLSGSSQGDLWRPIDVSPAPDPSNTSSGYDFYYSQLDKVQGWAAKVPPKRGDFAMGTVGDEPFRVAFQAYRDATYGKFPDPNQPIGDAPKFLVKVEEVPVLLPSDPNYDAEAAKHAGEVKITSIGLSDDDPNVFHRAIAYKSGRRKSPWASALRSVSNWKFGQSEDTTGVPYGDVTTPVTANPSANVNVTIDNSNKPKFSESDAPFNIVIVKKDASPVVRGAVVTKVDTTGTILTLAKLDNDILKDEVIQKAAAIGTASTIDLLNTGQQPSPAFPQTFPDQAQPNGILANGSLWLQGQIRLSALQKFGSKIQTSGSLVVDGTKNVDGGNSSDVTTGGGQLISSNVNTGPNVFPGTFSTVSGVNKTDLVNDGWNKIGAQTLGLDYSSSRDVEPFKPAKIDSAENLARYRALTRNSAIISPIERVGLYIDNREDVEKVGTTSMSQQQLTNMLLSPPTATDNYTRTGTAEAVNAPNKSLEEQHLRGWVGPDEFLARGALVELMPANGPNFPVPYLRVTLDARGDNIATDVTRAAGPVLAKSWRDTNGNVNNGVYTRNFAWPANGTIFSEGNVRIRGVITDPANPAPRSLTVVSMGNIYIEGSVSVDNRTVPDPNNSALTIPDPNRNKLMLLAKKNVIVNPTRAVLARTDVQTVATNTGAITLAGIPTPIVAGTYATAANFNIQVADSQIFNTGDYAEVSVPSVTDPIRGLITAINNGTNTLTIRSTAGGSIPVSTTLAPVIVRSPLEKSNQITTTSMNKAFFSLVKLENAINRRVVASITQDTSANRNRIVFDHMGVKQTTVAGLTITAKDYTDNAIPRPSGFTAFLTNKQPLLANSNTPPDENLDSGETGVTSANKILRTYNTFSANNRKPFNEFPVTPPPTTTPKPISQLMAEIIATEEMTAGLTPKGYRYIATPTNPAFGTLPSNALAGVGLRYEPSIGFVAPTDVNEMSRRKNFNAATTPVAGEFTIPLATSVGYDLNGGLSNLLPLSGSRVTKYIGFNPGFGTTDNDDALTVDSSFYQLNTDTDRYSTIDSRVLALVPSADANLTAFPQSIVLKRSDELTTPAISALLPDYEVKSMKLENVELSGTSAKIKPVASSMQINAFVYAQEGSWIVIPSDYFRSGPPVRGIADTNGTLIGSYIDYNGDKSPLDPTTGLPDPKESIPASTGSARIADLNRNGKEDGGERDAALRFLRYNSAPIRFYGAIIENQTAVVADVKDAAQTNVLVTGAVQDWMNKWATFDDTATGAVQGNKANFQFMTYTYDPSLALGSVGSSQLRVPVTDDLLYQQ